MTETAEAQRTRILLAAPDCSPSDYDSAVALGYEPESWEGMWKLPEHRPILWISRNWAIVREVSVDERGFGRRTRRGRIKLKYKLRRAVA